MTDLPHQRVVDQPKVGYFKLRLVKRGPWVGARIDQIDGKWVATIDGTEQSPGHEDPVEAKGVLKVWHAGQFISQPEYNYLVQLAAWAREHSPDHPAANPGKPIDLATLPPVFKKANP
jgi:hypothetical protein